MQADHDTLTETIARLERKAKHDSEEAERRQVDLEAQDEELKQLRGDVIRLRQENLDLRTASLRLEAQKSQLEDAKSVDDEACKQFVDALAQDHQNQINVLQAEIDMLRAKLEGRVEVDSMSTTTPQRRCAKRLRDGSPTGGQGASGDAVASAHSRQTRMRTALPSKSKADPVAEAIAQSLDFECDLYNTMSAPMSGAVADQMLLYLAAQKANQPLAAATTAIERAAQAWLPIWSRAQSVYDSNPARFTKLLNEAVRSRPPLPY
eukprot:gnl/Hemi2/23905_TR8025_c0_g3_i2.p1 gnl/Hemi2/23905_TR8025_c0_g3~~gnl/Hemi2/23905_TR8025_c0_g3_i2.p1  ORF type:complete len:309 (-),score=68.32 gnl/Hemi2/23905_TR8025_c0_g3_i2:73-864(-)